MVNAKTHANIKGALKVQRITFSDIARSLGVKPATVIIVSQGFRRSRRIETAIADAIRSTPERVWPERYPESGEEASSMTA